MLRTFQFGFSPNKTTNSTESLGRVKALTTFDAITLTDRNFDQDFLPLVTSRSTVFSFPGSTDGAQAAAPFPKETTLSPPPGIAQKVQLQRRVVRFRDQFTPHLWINFKTRLGGIWERVTLDSFVGAAGVKEGEQRTSRYAKYIKFNCGDQSRFSPCPNSPVYIISRMNQLLESRSTSTVDALIDAAQAVAITVLFYDTSLTLGEEVRATYIAILQTSHSIPTLITRYNTCGPKNGMLLRRASI
ncbi:13421_t:CDS:2, partial [Acaulospora colombiana]